MATGTLQWSMGSRLTGWPDSGRIVAPAGEIHGLWWDTPYPLNLPDGRVQSPGGLGDWHGRLRSATLGQNPGTSAAPSLLRVGQTRPRSEAASISTPALSPTLPLQTPEREIWSVATYQPARPMAKARNQKKLITSPPTNILFTPLPGVEALASHRVRHPRTRPSIEQGVCQNPQRSD